MAPTSPLRQVRQYFGMTTDEHIEELRLAPVGTMVQLEGGPPVISSLIDSAPPAEPAAAAEKAQPEPSGRSQSPEVAVALAPHADTASGDGYQTAPSAPEVSPPAFPSVSPAAPEGRRSRQCTVRPKNYVDYVDSSLSQPPESSDDNSDFGTLYARKRSKGGSRRGRRNSSGKRTSGSKRASGGAGGKRSTASRKRISGTAAQPSSPQEDARGGTALSGDDSADEADDEEKPEPKMIFDMQRAAKASGGGAKKRQRSSSAAAGQQRAASGRASGKRARKCSPPQVGAKWSDAEEDAAAAPDAGPDAAEVHSAEPGAAAETADAAVEDAAGKGSPNISTAEELDAAAPEADAAAEQAAAHGGLQISHSAAQALDASLGSARKHPLGQETAAAVPAAEPALTEERQAEKAAAKAACKAARKAERKAAKVAAKASGCDVAAGKHHSKVDKGSKGLAKPSGAAKTAQKQQMSGAPRRDTSFAAPGDTEQQQQDEDQGSQPCSDPSASRQQAAAKPFVSPLLASLSKAHGPPAKKVIPAAVLAAQGQSRPATADLAAARGLAFDSPAPAAQPFKAPLAAAGGAVASRRISGSSGQKSITRPPQQRFKLAGLRKTDKPLHSNLKARASA